MRRLKARGGGGYAAACEQIGKQYTCHSLRHAFASLLALMGEHMKDIALLRHRSDPTVFEALPACPGGARPTAPPS